MYVKFFPWWDLTFLSKISKETKLGLLNSHVCLHACARSNWMPTMEQLMILQISCSQSKLVDSTLTVAASSLVSCQVLAQSWNLKLKMLREQTMESSLRSTMACTMSAALVLISTNSITHQEVTMKKLFSCLLSSCWTCSISKQWDMDLERFKNSPSFLRFKTPPKIFK